MTKTDAQREATKLLGSSASRILLCGGSRSGKTFILCRSVFIRALKEPGSQHAIGRLHFTHVVSSLVYQTIPKMLEVCWPGLDVKLNRQHWYYELPNKSQIWLFGFDQKERVEKILGTEWSTIYLNEVSMLEWNLVTMALTRLAAKTRLKNKLYLDQNPPSKAHWTYKVFVLHKDPETGQPLPDPDNWQTMLMNPNSNLQNLDENYLATLMALPERARKRFLMGEYQDDIVGALWNDFIIDKNREQEIPLNLVRVVVAVDPATTHGPDADDTGILVTGESITGHIYVLEDQTGKYSPNMWASKVAMLYHKWMADSVVGEGNQGGEMVRAMIQNTEPDIKVNIVHATRGKITRAEPVAGLYEQGRVHHVGRFPQLEDQMVRYTGEAGQDSPNNMDALVWAITELTSKRKNIIAV